ncbi:MAG: DUF962 domain-containing protein [Flavobacteriales bacterium]|nr:DUF962 domain-containing protein [Flavobacteriales bacterium]
MRTINDWLDEYGESHRNKTNKIIHWICVPAIFFSIYGLIYSIPFTFFSSELTPYLNYASILMLLVLSFYIRLSFKLALGMLIYMLLVIWSTSLLDSKIELDYWLFSLIVFIVAWIGQFIGHHIEGAKPSFFKDLQFLLIGPAWVISFIYKKLNITL